MIAFLRRLFARGEPVLSEVSARDAPAMARLHGASFHRGWSDGEIERMLIERDMLGHRAMSGPSLAGFILSDRVLEEAEILSVAVASPWRGRGLARRLGRADETPRYRRVLVGVGDKGASDHP